MDSPQSVVSPLKNSVLHEPEKPNTNGFRSREINFREKEPTTVNIDHFLGALEVYIHQARDIHNICIYQKQDVYAKLCLTSDPDITVSTKIINGGGRNPIFNENLSLNVRKVDSSLKCEIWMLSRVKNYLEDQLLGFALVPISEVFMHNGKLEKEFSLSSTDLFHSPAGFVQLSVSYIGEQPEVITLPAPPTCVETDSVLPDKECSDLDRIEFPDPNVVNENHQMVEEYFGMPCSSEGPVGSDSETHESFSVGPTKTSNPSQIPKIIESPPSSVSTDGASSDSVPASFESCETPKDSKSPNGEQNSPPKDNSKDKKANDLDSESNESASTTFIKPIVPESKVVQQDIVDMYMKSMQQFTESLAKMKLPMDFENGPSSSENSSSDQKSPASKNSGSRVFYGSRAFF